MALFQSVVPCFGFLSLDMFFLFHRVVLCPALFSSVPFWWYIFLFCFTPSCFAVRPFYRLFDTQHLFCSLPCCFILFFSTLLYVAVVYCALLSLSQLCFRRFGSTLPSFVLYSTVIFSSFAFCALWYFTLLRLVFSIPLCSTLFCAILMYSSAFLTLFLSFLFSFVFLYYSLISFVLSDLLFSSALFYSMLFHIYSVVFTSSLLSYALFFSTPLRFDVLYFTLSCSLISCSLLLHLALLYVTVFSSTLLFSILLNFALLRFFSVYFTLHCSVMLSFFLMFSPCLL